MNVCLPLCLLSSGKHPSDVRGTMSFFSVPDRVQGSPSAKAVWKIALHKSSSPLTGLLNLTITPPADTPIGEYLMYVTHRDEKMLLATPVVLFNPWCPGKMSVYCYIDCYFDIYCYLYLLLIIYVPFADDVLLLKLRSELITYILSNLLTYRLSVCLN